MAEAASPLEFAARLDDTIEHTGAMFGAVVGAIAGIALGIFVCWLCVITAPVSIFMMIGAAAVFGSGIGEFLGKKLEKHDAGDIAEGSRTVFVGAPDRNAARVDDKVKCHSGMIIVSGTRTIEIEGHKAARVGEETECDGKIKTGCLTVKYGGPSIQMHPKRFSGEINPWFWGIREAVDLITCFYNWYGLWKEGWKALSLVGKIIEGAGAITTVIDKGLGYTSMIANAAGNYEVAKWIGENVTDTWWYKGVTTTVGAAGLGRGIHENYAKAHEVAVPTPQLALPAPTPQLALPAPKPQLALPAPQPQLALPAPKPQLALPAPQPQLALPAPKPMLALPAPEPQLLLPGPTTGGTPGGAPGG